MQAVDAIMDAAPVMAVVTVESAAAAVDLSRALVAGGCSLIEITMRTPVALDAIRAVAADVPDAIVGAGTVTNGGDFERAVEAGSRFAVSPGATPALLRAAKDGPIPFLPGIASASDLMAGLDEGYRRFKFFPAEAAGGIAALKALGGPFPDVRFCPTGGINLANAGDYLALRNVACVGGSWVAPAKLIADARWDDITELARGAAALASA